MTDSSLLGHVSRCDLPRGVVHMGHDDTVSRNDRPTENGGAEVQYPARRLVRYEGDHREQGCGGRERRGDDDKASVEAVRKPADTRLKEQFIAIVAFYCRPAQDHPAGAQP